jgi:arylsulfatase A-like enzyme
LVTGRYQPRFGHEFNPGNNAVRTDFGLPLTEKTIADALKAAGYKTALVGKWHLGSTPEYHPLKRGYDEFYGFLGGAHPYQLPDSKPGAPPILRGEEPIDEQEYLTDAIGREAVAFIDRNAEQPFYLQLTFNAVHTPLEAPAKYQDRFSKIEDPKHRAYAGMLSALDDNVGRVLDELSKHKLDNDTLVFFISDNGGPPFANTSSNHPLAGSKGTVWEGGIRIPFVIRWPGHVPAGAVYEQPVISLDISATAAAATGAKLGGEQAIDGVNLLPFIAGPDKAAPHADLFWRFGPQWAVRQGNYKLAKTADSDKPQLFDLQSDIGEQHDLASAEPKLVAKLQESFDGWNSQLAKPLWEPARRANGKQKAGKQRTAAKQKQAD